MWIINKLCCLPFTMRIKTYQNTAVCFKHEHEQKQEKELVIAEAPQHVFN